MSSRYLCCLDIADAAQPITPRVGPWVMKKWAALLPVVATIVVPVEQWLIGEPSKCKDPIFLQQLVDCDPQKRATARAVLQTCGLPREYADPILQQTSDVDKVCAASKPPHAPASPLSAHSQDPLPTELRAKNLLGVLRDASDYAVANSPQESEQALKLYLAVLPKLSDPARRALDQRLMGKLNAALKIHDTGRAVSVLRSAFLPYVTKQ